MLQMTMTMGTAAATTMSTGVATTVTAMATSTTAAPLQPLLPLHQVVTRQHLPQLLLASGTFLATAITITVTTTTMSQALHQLQPLQVVVMLLQLPQLHLQVLLYITNVSCLAQHTVQIVLFSQCCADNAGVSHRRVLTGHDFIVLFVQRATSLMLQLKLFISAYQLTC